MSNEIVNRMQEGKYAEALALCEKIPALPTYPQTYHLYGRLLMATGKFLDGLAVFEALRRNNLFGDTLIKTTQPRWSGETLHGKRLLIVTEGGLGDIVCFSRFATQFRDRGAEVLIASDPLMYGLLKSIDGVSHVVTAAQAQQYGERLFDYWIPALSAPLLLGLTPEHIHGAPYMRLPANFAEPWEDQLRPGLRIGVAWQGNADFAEDSLRSIKGAAFATLFDVPGATFYKLRMWEAHNRIEDPRLIDIADDIRHPTALAAFITHMDLIISVDSAPAHLAGALGKPVWMFNRAFGWITFAYPPHATKTPWYDSMRLYTQETYGSWKEPLERCKKDLYEFVKNNTNAGSSS